MIEGTCGFRAIVVRENPCGLGNDDALGSLSSSDRRKITSEGASAVGDKNVTNGASGGRRVVATPEASNTIEPSAWSNKDRRRAAPKGFQVERRGDAFFALAVISPAEGQ